MRVAAAVVLCAAPILVATSLGWGVGGSGNDSHERARARVEFGALLGSMEHLVAEQRRGLATLERLLTTHEWIAMTQYVEWLTHTDYYLHVIAGMGHRTLRVTPEEMRNYYDRHEEPLEAAQAILTDLNFPPELIKERSTVE